MSISVAPLGSFGSKLSLNAAELPKLDAEFEEITEGEELTKEESRAAWDAARQTERSAARRVQKSRSDDCINRKTKWAALEALVGDPKRIALVAADLVAHFEKRVEAMDGKAIPTGLAGRGSEDRARASGTSLRGMGVRLWASDASIRSHS